MTLATTREQAPSGTSKAKRDTTRGVRTNSPQRRVSFPVPFVQRKPACACGGGCPRCEENSAQGGLEIGHPKDGYEREADHVAEQMIRMPEPQLQRACACANHTMAWGECSECREKDRLGLQTKLKVNEPGDIYEREADRVADQVMATPAHPAVNGTPPRIQRFTGQPTGQTEVAPASVDQALASPGRPLEPALRQDMEPRFGHDFGQVRVHTDGRAGASARAVNAHAYTVGENIVFAIGRFSPQTTEGRRLLAHELAHVAQQKQGKQQLQRWATCKPARFSLEDCPPRQPGEEQRARSGPMVFLPKLHDLSSGEQGVLIANFNIGSSAIKPNLHRTIYWKNFLEEITLKRSRWKLLGFTDCQDEDRLNEKTREQRAAAVFNILPKEVQPQITSYKAAPTYECITENSNAGDRTLNRSVALIFESSVTEFTPEDVPSSLRKEPETRQCSKAQRDRLAVAFPDAELMIKNAVAIISVMKKGSEQEVLFMKYFGKDAFAHRWHIMRGFVDTLRQWKKRGPTYPYVCVKQGAGECTPGTLGYVESFGLPGWTWGPKGDIHICEEAFKLDDNRKLAAVLIHETSHMLDWTTTDEYCGMETNRGCSLETTKAEDNADSYAQFAREAFERGLGLTQL